MRGQVQAFFFAPQMPPEQASARYKKLALVLHPDSETGDTVLMQRLNVEFDAYKAGRLLPAAAPYTAPQEPPPPPKPDRAEQLRQTAQKIIEALPAIPGVRLIFDPAAEHIVAVGDTYPAKDTLRGLGFRWNPDRCCWWMKVSPYG